MYNVDTFTASTTSVYLHIHSFKIWILNENNIRNFAMATNQNRISYIRSIFGP